MFGPLLEVEMSKKCTRLWHEAHFEVTMYKTPQPRTTFGSRDVGKVHGIEARSAFPSQNVQRTSVSERFWKLRCRKSGRRCGAKHIPKSKCTKHTDFGTFFKSRCRKSARSCGAKHIPSQNVKSTTCSDNFLFRCGSAWQAQGVLHLAKSEQNIRVLLHFQKRWQAWGICRGSGRMHVAWQGQ